jgi:cytochrome-b5 reductase
MTTLPPFPKVRAAGRRNKVPLEKGFSQVDWLRLARSGQDMRGAPKERGRCCGRDNDGCVGFATAHDAHKHITQQTQHMHIPTAGHGLCRDIPMDEVRRHNTRGDAWMVLSGRVYNLTPYFPFHPGGEDVLMQAAGRDGTALFRRYHPWVNGHALLEACLLGSLKVSPGGARSPLGPGLSGSGAVATPAAAAAAVGSSSNGSGNVGGSGGGEDGGAPRQTAPPSNGSGGSGGSGDAIT